MQADNCSSNPNCTFTKKGCKARSGTKSRKGAKPLVYQGPALPVGFMRT
jgi:hypothetical protein